MKSGNINIVSVVGCEGLSICNKTKDSLDGLKCDEKTDLNAVLSRCVRH